MPIPANTDVIQEQFFYNAEFINIASAATSIVNINIQADADFIIVKQTRDVRLTGTPTLVVNPNGLVLITDTGSGRQIMDIAVHIENFFGTGQFPYIYPQTKRIGAASTLAVQLTNNGGAAWDARLDFSGYKQYIYDRGGVR